MFGGRKTQKENVFLRKNVGGVVLLIFMLGPAVDILTSAISNSTVLTPGVVLRVLFIMYAIFYLLFADKARRKLNIALLACFFLLLLSSVVMNFDLIVNLNFSYIGYLVKLMFFCVGLMYFVAWSSVTDCFDVYMFRIPFLIIIVSYFLALITGTAYTTYSTWGDGYSGWISSANEFSALLCCLYPFALYNAFRRDSEKKIWYKMLDFMIVVSASIIMVMTGTKASLFGFIILAAAYFIYRIVTVKVNHFTPMLIILPVLLLATVILWNNLPAITNMNGRISNIGLVDMKVQAKGVEKKASGLSASTRKATVDDEMRVVAGGVLASSNSSVAEKTDKVIWSGRDNFAKELEELRDGDGEANKVMVFLFGKAYRTEQKPVAIVERDFHDTFYLFGFFNLLFVLILILPRIILAIIRFFATMKESSNHFLFIVLCSVMISLGAAFICGHTLLSPAVSSFLLISFSLLLKQPNSEKRTVVFVASAGGHLTQIMMLEPIFSRYNSYLVTEKTPINLKVKVPLKYVIYCSRKQPASYLFKSVVNFLRSFYLFAVINPDVIVTTGTHTAVPLCIIGWFARRKVIYIESFAKNSSPTMTGRILYPFTDVFIIQWRSMKKFYPKAKYFGGIY